jgi:hypothetical protein
MSKILTFVLLAIIMNICHSKNPWDCGDNKHFCQEGQQCCSAIVKLNFMDEMKFKCFDDISGECCQDSPRMCEKGTTCNNQTGGCDPIPEPEPVDPFTPKDAGDLFDGFMKGLVVFSRLPHSMYCDYRHLEPIQNDVIEIIKIIRSMKFDLELVNQISDIFINFKRIYNDSKKIVGECEQFGKEIAMKMEDIIKFMDKGDYSKQFIRHVLTELDTFRKKAEFATDLFNQKDYLFAGRGYGDLVYFTLLWNYKN